MKKILAMLLALTLLMSTGLCFAESAEDDGPDVREIWDIIAMFKDDVPMEEGTYPLISLFLYDDGTVRVESNEYAYTGTFTTTDDPVGYLVNAADVISHFIYDAESGYLYLMDEVSGTTGVFAIRVDLPAELNAESMDEFQGTWRISSVIRYGRLVDLASEAGQEILESWNNVDPTVIIEGNNVTFLGSRQGTAEFVDGGLIVTTPDGEFTITRVEINGIVCKVQGENISISHLYADKE